MLRRGRGGPQVDYRRGPKVDLDAGHMHGHGLAVESSPAVLRSRSTPREPPRTSDPGRRAGAGRRGREAAPRQEGPPRAAHHLPTTLRATSTTLSAVILKNL